MARLAIIGAGWSGLSAALTLSELGHQCTVFEAARSVGGRARSVLWHCEDGTTLTVDNGQHILLGAYASTLETLQRVGLAEADVLTRLPLQFKAASGFALQAPRWPAPLHLIAAISNARGLTWRERLAMLRIMHDLRHHHWRLSGDCTVFELLMSHRQPARLVTEFWEPLCVAALNTPINEASAQIFVNVLRDSLGARRAASDLLLPRTGLDNLFPHAARETLEREGHSVHTGSAIRTLDRTSEGISLTDAHERQHDFAGAVCAVAPQHVALLLHGHEDCQELVQSCQQFTYQSITTAWMLYPEARHLHCPMLALNTNHEDNEFGQWVFDHSYLGGPPGLLSVVISADGPHRSLDASALTQHLADQLARQANIDAPLRDSRIIVEKRATFSCTPNLQRPGNTTPWPRLVLAGDYTASPYPATLEAAVSSGQRAALALHYSLAS